VRPFVVPGMIDGMASTHPPTPAGDLPSIGRPAASVLREQGVSTLEHVAQWREADLLALHGVGPRAVAMLRAALAAAGLGFRP